jgi:inosine-uridine nucleoside N-ribohydrolase
MAHKIIIDTDIGMYYDDAMAVMLASRSPEIDLLGVTTVYADTGQRARIARKILNTVGRPDVPVAKGIGPPLQGTYLAFAFEGQNILEEGDGDLAPIEEHAVNFIIRTIMENPGEVSLVTLGPLTNVAVAIRMEPAILDAVKEIIIMGGVLVPIVDAKGVRRSPVEENNMNSDAVAAKIVMHSGGPITLCPIDVTMQVALRDRDLSALAASGDPAARLATAIFDVWPEQEHQFNLSTGIPHEHTAFWLHDPLTVALVYDRSLCEITPLYIETDFAPTPVERDALIHTDILRTIPKKRPPNMDVAVTVEVDRFLDLFTGRMCGTA